MLHYRLLARLLLIGSVCLLTTAQTTRSFECIALLDSPALANQSQGFAGHAVEEVSSAPVADCGVAQTSATFETEEPQEHQPDPQILGEVEVGTEWSSEHRFHRRIPPRSAADDYN
jgi:hypothetical protein